MVKKIWNQTRSVCRGRGGELLDTVMRIASGEKTRGEINGFHDLAIFKQGITL